MEVTKLGQSDFFSGLVLDIKEKDNGLYKHKPFFSEHYANFEVEKILYFHPEVSYNFAQVLIVHSCTS